MSAHAEALEALTSECESDRRQLVELVRQRELREARDEERSTVAVRAAARASASERRRMALVGSVIAILTVISPHVHL